MNDTKNVSIALLTITAVLLGLLVMGTMRGNKAYAAAAAVGGRYVMINGQNGTYTDLIYVIDVIDQTINVYAYNRKTHLLDPADQVDLRKAFRTGARGIQPRGRKSPRRGY